MELAFINSMASLTDAWGPMVMGFVIINDWIFMWPLYRGVFSKNQQLSFLRPAFQIFVFDVFYGPLFQEKWNVGILGSAE
jgi:hypothetical protein